MCVLFSCHDLSLTSDFSSRCTGVAWSQACTLSIDLLTSLREILRTANEDANTQDRVGMFNEINTRSLNSGSTRVRELDQECRDVVLTMSPPAGRPVGRCVCVCVRLLQIKLTAQQRENLLNSSAFRSFERQSCQLQVR